MRLLRPMTVIGYWSTVFGPEAWNGSIWNTIIVEKRWGAFADMYQKELERSHAVKTFIDRIKPYEKVTLLYASKNQEQNHARVLAQYLSTLF